MKAAIVNASAAARGARAALVCNCDADEIGAILDAMAAMAWPTAQTRLLLSDRSTPTRLVADAAHVAFSASVQTQGVLPHIPRERNPAYAALEERWERSGGDGALFASALSTCDGARARRSSGRG